MLELCRFCFPSKQEHEYNYRMILAQLPSHYQAKWSDLSLGRFDQPLWKQFYSSKLMKEIHSQHDAYRVDAWYSPWDPADRLLYLFGWGKMRRMPQSRNAYSSNEENVGNRGEKNAIFADLPNKKPQKNPTPRYTCDRGQLGSDKGWEPLRERVPCDPARSHTDKKQSTPINYRKFVQGMPDWSPWRYASNSHRKPHQLWRTSAVNQE